MATTKGGNKKPVMLSSHVQQVTSAVQAGVANALKNEVPAVGGQMMNLGPHVNPKTAIITVTFIIDLS